MADHEAEAVQDPTPTETTGSRKPVLIGAVAGTVVVGAAVGFMVLGPMIRPSSGSTHDETTEVGPVDGDNGEPGEAAGGRVHVIDNMVLNPAMSSGARFLLVATVTPRSLDELGLAPGHAVLAMCKASALHVISEAASLDTPTGPAL